MAGRDDLAQPVDVLLLEDAPDDEEVERAARLLHAPRGFDGVALGFVVEVSLFVVPVDLILGRVLGAHFQIERDGDLGFVAEPVLFGEKALCARPFCAATRSSGSSSDATSARSQPPGGCRRRIVGADPAVGDVDLPAEANPTEPYRRRLTTDLGAARRGREPFAAGRAPGRARPRRGEPARAPRRADRRRRPRRAAPAARRLRPPRRRARPARARAHAARARRTSSGPCWRRRRRSSGAHGPRGDRHARRLDDAERGRRARRRGARGARPGLDVTRRAAARDDRRPARRRRSRRRSCSTARRGPRSR